MNTGILAAVILYEVVAILGIGIWISRRQKGRAETDGFTHAGRGLPLPAVALTFALTVLGAVHIVGVFELTFVFGASVLWFALAHVILLCLTCLATGRWVKRLNISTVPQFLEDAYGLPVRLLVSSVMIGAIFGIITLEAQGLGVIFASMAGWPIQVGSVLGGVLAMLYVLLAGMKEVSYLNFINAIVMCLALILAVIVLGHGAQKSPPLTCWWNYCQGGCQRFCWRRLSASSFRPLR